MSNSLNASNALAGLVRIEPSKPIKAFFADPENRFGIATNIDLVGDEAFALVLKAQNQPTVPTESVEQTPFPVRYYYAHQVELANQRTGEVEERTRLVLISPELETCSFVSGGILDSLDLLRRFKGDGPYDPPLCVLAARQKTRGGNTMLRLEYVPGSATDETAVDGRRKK
ncbi:MAG TPA: hypothetical protein VFH56_16370 [Acidimicrobiales bacterium]|nr:hypothetical protein [Acidimicrobiales bacterium]